MPNYRRARVAGGTYFFTVVAGGRQPVLITEPVRRALREAIARVRAAQPFRVDAWVLLPDHIHCLWTLPPDDADFSSRWSAIKRLTSQAVAAGDAGRKSGLWQERFWEHLIRDDADFARHADYIHWNPVKARPCRPRGGLAVFHLPPLLRARRLSRGLGRRQRPPCVRGGVRRVGDRRARPALRWMAWRGRRARPALRIASWRSNSRRAGRARHANRGFSGSGRGG